MSQATPEGTWAGTPEVVIHPAQWPQQEVDFRPGSRVWPLLRQQGLWLRGCALTRSSSVQGEDGLHHVLTLSAPSTRSRLLLTRTTTLCTGHQLATPGCAGDEIEAGLGGPVQEA